MSESKCQDKTLVSENARINSCPGRIRAARKVGAGEAEALREKVRHNIQYGLKNILMHFFRSLDFTAPTVLLWQLTGRGWRREC